MKAKVRVEPAMIGVAEARKGAFFNHHVSPEGLLGLKIGRMIGA